MHNTDEILDIVDKNDNIIGQKSRSEIYSQSLKNFRVVNVFLKNNKGKLFIPRRTASKRIFPLCLDVSVGGHVETGENYDQAFRREVLEELNINIDNFEWRRLGKLSPLQNDVSAFMQVYEITCDQTPDFNKDDFVEYFWLLPIDAIEKISSDKSKDDLPKLLKCFYLR